MTSDRRFLAVMGFKAIFDEIVPNHLKLTEKVAKTCNLRSNNKGILINANQQPKSFEKQTENIFNKVTINVRSIEKLSILKN